MPRPAYIICAEAGAEDSMTGLLSFFQVYENVRVFSALASTVQPNTPGLIPQSLRATAVWMKSPSDQLDQEYDFETCFYAPPNETETIVHKGKFSFGEKPFFRMVLLGQAPAWGGPGVFRVESRIRRAGSADEWLRQDFPILIDIATPEQQTPIDPSSA